MKEKTMRVVFCTLTFLGSVGASAETIMFDDPVVPTRTLSAAVSGVTAITSSIPGATLDVSKTPGDHPDNHGISLSSSDGTNPAEIVLTQEGALTVNADLTDLAFDVADTCVSGSRATDVTDDTFLPAKGSAEPDRFTGAEVVYWKDRSLSDVKAFRAKVVDENGSKGFVARSLHFQNDGTTASVEFSFRRDALSICCAKVEFKQVGSDITARVCWIRAISDAPDEAISGEDYAGALSVEQGVYDGETVTDGVGIRAIEAGELGSLGGKGLAVRSTYGTVADQSVSSTAAKTYWTNLKISDIDDVLGLVSRWSQQWCRAYVVSRSETSMTVDFQHNVDSSWLTAMRVELTQNGADITAKKVYAGYNTHTRELTDFTGWTWGGKGYAEGLSNFDSNTQILQMIPVLKPDLALNGDVRMGGALTLGGHTVEIGSAAVTDGSFPVTGIGSVRYVNSRTDGGRAGLRWVQVATNDYTGMTVFDGVNANLSAAAHSQTKVFVVTNGATVSISNYGQTIPLAVPRSFYVYPDSTLAISTPNEQTFWKNSFFVYGGDFNLESGAQIGNLFLANGGRVYGKKSLAMGYWCVTPAIVSDGDGACTNEIASALCPTPRYESAFLLLNCRGADLLHSGAIQYDQSYAKVPFFCKGGSKKLILASTANATTSRFEVVQGPLRLATATAMGADNGVNLYADASLEIAAGLDVTLGPVVVTNSSTQASSVSKIIVEDGASLSLAANGLRFANGGMLCIEGGRPENTRVRIGTSKCLTDDQLEAIHWISGGRVHKVSQDADGYLCFLGFCVILR